MVANRAAWLRASAAEWSRCRLATARLRATFFGRTIDGVACCFEPPVNWAADYRRSIGGYSLICAAFLSRGWQTTRTQRHERRAACYRSTSARRSRTQFSTLPLAQRRGSMMAEAKERGGQIGALFGILSGDAPIFARSPPSLPDASLNTRYARVCPRSFSMQALALSMTIRCKIKFLNSRVILLCEVAEQNKHTKSIGNSRDKKTTKHVVMPEIQFSRYRLSIIISNIATAKIS